MTTLPDAPALTIDDIKTAMDSILAEKMPDYLSDVVKHDDLKTFVSTTQLTDAMKEAEKAAVDRVKEMLTEYARTESMERHERQIADNAAAIRQLQALQEAAVKGIQSSVASIQSSVETMLTMVKQNGDRVNALSERQRQLDERVSAAEAHQDKTDGEVRTSNEINEDLRARLMGFTQKVEPFLFGGDGHVGLVSTMRTQDDRIAALTATLSPITVYIQELQNRDEIQRKRMEWIKETLGGILKDKWAILVAAAGVPVGGVLWEFLRTIFGG